MTTSSLFDRQPPFDLCDALLASEASGADLASDLVLLLSLQRVAGLVDFCKGGVGDRFGQ